MKEGMLDIETMGNNSNAPITAIGLIIRDYVTGEDVSFYTEVSLESSVKVGSQMDASTVLWWMKQSEDARSIYTNNHTAPELQIALSTLTNFVNNTCEKGSKGEPLLRLWGNGVAFDNVILHNAYKSVNLDCPFAFWNDACYRTLKGLYPQVNLIRFGTYHNALDDALSQMNHLFSIFKESGL